MSTEKRDAEKYEMQIAKVEGELCEAKQVIQRQEQENDELAEAVDSLDSTFSNRQTGTLNAAFQFVDMCQKSLDGQHVCGLDGCTVERRELKPEESAAFSAACDMLSRVFDSEFQLERGVSPEAVESE